MPPLERERHVWVQAPGWHRLARPRPLDRGPCSPGRSPRTVPRDARGAAGRAAAPRRLQRHRRDPHRRGPGPGVHPQGLVPRRRAGLPRPRVRTRAGRGSRRRRGHRPHRRRPQRWQPLQPAARVRAADCRGQRPISIGGGGGTGGGLAGWPRRRRRRGARRGRDERRVAGGRGDRPRWGARRRSADHLRPRRDGDARERRHRPLRHPRGGAGRPRRRISAPNTCRPGRCGPSPSPAPRPTSRCSSRSSASTMSAKSRMLAGLFDAARAILGAEEAGSLGSLGFPNAPVVTSMFAEPTDSGTTVGLDVWHRAFGSLALAGVTAVGSRRPCSRASSPTPSSGPSWSATRPRQSGPSCPRWASAPAPAVAPVATPIARQGGGGTSRRTPSPGATATASNVTGGSLSTSTRYVPTGRSTPAPPTTPDRTSTLSES